MRGTRSGGSGGSGGGGGDLIIGKNSRTRRSPTVLYGSSSSSSSTTVSSLFSFMALSQDTKNILLLIILYMIQGVPLGLAYGSLPFLLQKKFSYSDLGVFALAGYPYSLKLFWSPIVDSVFHPRFGRRKSWIIPVQFICSLLLFYAGTWLEDALAVGSETSIWGFTVFFFILIVFTATQDIAVDGWAITILSNQSLSYASTCQTIGLNVGFFLSYTVFLALNSEDFVNQYLRSQWWWPGAGPSPEPLLTVGSYVTFWAGVYFVTTAALLLKDEGSSISPGEDLSVTSVYRKIVKIVKKPTVYAFLFVLLTSKLGFAAVDSVLSIALVERGFPREDMALFSLIEFPFQIATSLLIGKLSAGTTPLAPWMMGYKVKTLAGFLGIAIVYYYPSDGQLSTFYFLSILFVNLLTSFGTTAMFVANGSFFARISDASIGGTYLTLLNTFSNFGGTWPRFFVFLAVEHFTQRHCRNPVNSEILVGPEELHSDKAQCIAQGGKMILEEDGFFPVNTILLILGALFYWWYLRPKLEKLQRAPASSWTIEPSPSSPSLSSEERRDSK